MSKWQPIETAPKSTTVLIHWAESAGWDGTTMLGGLIDDLGKCYWVEDWGPHESRKCHGSPPTHWASLPELPKPGG